MDLVPWGRNRSMVAPRFSDEGSPFLALHREMNRMFDDFARGFGLDMPARSGMMGNWPHLEVGETEKEVRVTAELPGLNEKDVEVSLSDGMLTIKGEKKSESDNAWYSERWHGRFQRALPFGSDVDPDKVSAAFRNGVLTHPGQASRSTA
jgi:HSP20 family protein